MVGVYVPLQSVHRCPLQNWCPHLTMSRDKVNLDETRPEIHTSTNQWCLKRVRTKIPVGKIIPNFLVLTTEGLRVMTSLPTFISTRWMTPYDTINLFCISARWLRYYNYSKEWWSTANNHTSNWISHCIQAPGILAQQWWQHDVKNVSWTDKQNDLSCIITKALAWWECRTIWFNLYKSISKVASWAQCGKAIEESYKYSKILHLKFITGH